MSTTAKIVTARKSHRCDAARDSSWFRACSGWIRPGEQYVRMVCFPGDVNSGHAPWVMRGCLACSIGYTGPAGDIARDILAESLDELRAGVDHADH